MATSNDPAALYDAHYGTLVAIATTEFGIPESQAAWLADVVLVSILKYLDQLPDPGAWLAFSMRYAAHHYNQVRARNAH
jgi:hypothetical protein